MILAGLGELEDDLIAEIRELAARYNVEFYPTYFDWELSGDPASIESITDDLWSMTRDQWEDNLLIAYES